MLITRTFCVLTLLLSTIFHLGAADTLVITEFMASNTGPLTDEDGEFSDWIEIHNPGTNSVNADGWYLTDAAANLTKWQFPATNVPPNGYLIVFASSKDRRTPGRPLHTSFSLGAGGEYLALVRPDGTTITSEFSPRFPAQVPRVSYGIPVVQSVTTLLSAGAAARVYIPSNDVLSGTWIQPAFNDAAWMPATTGIGFETDNQGPFTPSTIANSATEFSGKQGSNNWFYGYWNKQADVNGIYSDIDFAPFPNADEAYGENNFFNGATWDWFAGDPPFTQISALGATPNASHGIPGRADHWPVRRYISEWNGPIKITGQVTHTSDWVYVTATGVAANSLLYVYLTAAGDGYIDDMKLVAGSVAEAGANLLPNGGFETALSPTWTVSANHSGSSLDTTVKREGNNSLHMVTSVGGTTQASAIWQTIAPALTVGGTYTLSFWFKPGSTPAPLTVRFSGDWIRVSPSFCGNGVTARIFVDGSEVLQQPAFVSGPTYSVTVPVNIGSRVDFALDPGTNDFCDASGFTAQIETADPANTVVADSIADWSFTGTQGEKNWQYGYYNRTADAGGVYAASDFTQFPRNAGSWSLNNYWDGAKWDWFNGNPPWDEIGQTAIHPNGINSGSEHWVIRRWVSEVSGRIVVEWKVAKSNPAGGGVTGRIFHNGVQMDFVTIAGADSAGANRSVTITNVSVGDFIDVALDPNGMGGDTSDSSDGSTMSAVIRGAPSLNDSIATDVRAAMQNINSTAYIRIPFNVADVSSINFLSLRMNYDDGFVAYLNGVQVAARNYSFFPDPLTWNSPATVNRPDGDVNEAEEIDITGFAGLLQPSGNILAIHGLNATAADSDFLMLPELRGIKVSFGTNTGYFAGPTPGSANGASSTNIGPLIAEVVHTPNVPTDDENLVVTAWVVPTFFAISNVQMTYRVMFSNEVTTPMFDDGTHGDGAAGDGVYGATIPATAAQPGQMVRYYISASDIRTNRARLPLFDIPATTGTQKSSPEYLGTIVYLPQTNNLPMLHWFIANTGGANSDAGTRCSIFWNGQFRDNVGVTLHGQSSSGFPKRAHNFNLNAGEKILAREGDPNVSDFAILSTWADRSHLRNSLNSETYQMAGVPSHYAFPIRVQQNGTFYCVANWIEQGDEEYLERIGYDPAGSLYKMYNTFTGAAGNEKKSRTHEGTDDLQGFYNALTQADVPARTAHIWDNVNIPATIDFLAAKTIGSDHDCCHKNYYLYRDSDGSGEWYALPWDFDLSYGHVWTSLNSWNYFDDTIITNLGTTVGNGMTLFSLMFSDPGMRQMWNLRTRTLVDQILQPVGTSNSVDILRNRIDYWANLIRNDSALDKVRWGGAAWGGPQFGPANPTTLDPTNNFERELVRLKDHYLPGRRSFLATLPTTTIPAAPPASAFMRFGSFDYNPASINQAEEYIELINTNTFAVDLSGWEIRGGVEFTFAPGTIVPAAAANVTNRIFVSPDLKAFRARAVSPKGGERRFVVGPYKGQLSARGETLALVNAAGVTNASLTFPGTPSSAQQYLRITEIMYAPPAPAAGSPYLREDFEYLELKNIGPVAINLAGVHFTNGIDFVFSVANTTNLNAGATIILAKNPAAFASRYPSVTAPVYAYLGSLDNAGETIRLDDAVGEKILEFAYNNSWYPMTDGNGLSLVIVNEAAPFYTWGDKVSWRPSSAFNGSPAQVDPPALTFAPILVNEVLTHTDLPVEDSIELYNPTTNAVDVGNWRLSDDFFGPLKYRIPAPSLIPAGGYLVITETAFNMGPAGFSLSSLGDEVYLFSGDVNGNPNGYFHGFEFGAAENGVSLGRHLTSTGGVHFVAQSSNTFGFPNALPKVGPIVISEIMYRPPDVNGQDNRIDEFVELQNITTNAVPLFDPAFPTNGWKLDDGIEFTFSTNDVVPARGFLIVVSFDPATNAAALATFRAKYGVSAAVPVAGPYSGQLGNSGENIELFKPDGPEVDGVPYILVERVHYSDASPWDGAADGFGPSLQRRVSTAYGDEHTNWMAALPSAGTGRNPGGSPAITQQPQNVVVTEGVSTNLSVVVSGTPPFGYQWFLNGQSLAGETAATLSLANPQVNQSGLYSVVVFNGAGAVFSSNATVVVRPLPVITVQPQNLTPRPGSNVTMSVTVSGTGAIRYQWRFNDEDIPGAINSAYTITNVQLAPHTGFYSVRITDDVASVTSQSATLIVLVNPIVTLQPVPQAVAQGQSARFTVVATPNHPMLPLNFRWLRNGVNWPSDGEPTLIINNCQSNGTYRVTITNLAGTVNSSAAGLTVLPDADGDGIPDSWEAQYYGNPTNASGTADTDGDGMINTDEFLAGTDPTNALSVLKLVRSATNSALLNFVAQTNRGYSVQYQTNLATTLWTSITNITISSQVRTMQLNAPIPPPESERFYRVVTPPLP